MKQTKNQPTKQNTLNITTASLDHVMFFCCSTEHLLFAPRTSEVTATGVFIDQGRRQRSELKLHTTQWISLKTNRHRASGDFVTAFPALPQPCSSQMRRTEMGSLIRLPAHLLVARLYWWIGSNSAEKGKREEWNTAQCAMRRKKTRNWFFKTFFFFLKEIEAEESSSCGWLCNGTAFSLFLVLKVIKCQGDHYLWAKF